MGGELGFAESGKTGENQVLGEKFRHRNLEILTFSKYKSLHVDDAGDGSSCCWAYCCPSFKVWL